MAGRIFVVSGPSGAGKDTLIERALAFVPGVYRSISATTRAPREGEEDGRDYYFMPEGRFKDLIKKERFLEWQEVYGNYYGTLKAEVEEAERMGKDILLGIDVKGALEVKSKRKDALLIFILPPSLEELKSRLAGRSGGEGMSEKDFSTRIAAAEEEIKEGKNFDVVIVNDEIERAALELGSVLKGEREQVR